MDPWIIIQEISGHETSKTKTRRHKLCLYNTSVVSSLILLQACLGDNTNEAGLNVLRLMNEVLYT